MFGGCIFTEIPAALAIVVRDSLIWSIVWEWRSTSCSYLPLYLIFQITNPLFHWKV